MKKASKEDKKKTPRYSVGIDLGTTNSILSYVDLTEEVKRPQTLAIPQIVAPGETQELPMLPSFIYMPTNAELGKGLYDLPWGGETGIVVGTYAQARSAEAPSRVIYSSKSWLCNERIDRHSQCLPLCPDDTADITKISPVDAARIILEYMRDAWNHKMAADDDSLRLEKQSIVITVPASFDAVARELTVEAANAAGLEFTLLEEPQAAFYSWLADHDRDWRDFASEGDVILVCDIGGGTTDFSLIAVKDSGGDLELQRIAVGNHTLLGGDNMDMTLAMSISQRLAAEKNIRLNQYQFIALTHACRRAKEAIGTGAKGAQPITIMGRGSSLLGSTISTQVTEEDLRSVLLDGFFPKCGIDEQPAQARRSGLRSFALDYAADPAFTRHLAAFLTAHCPKDDDGSTIVPGTVLFNGGITKAELFSERLLDAIDSWRGDAAPCKVLAQETPDLAVARGAAWYGHVSKNGGIRIKAGSARSYYIGIESAMPAIPGYQQQCDLLCVVSHGMEEGTEAEISEQGMALVVGEPSDFRLFTSTVRASDGIGVRLSQWDESAFTEMPPLTVSLPIGDDDKPGALVPVKLRTVLTAIGTLQLWCEEIGSQRRWKLEFELRDNSIASSN